MNTLLRKKKKNEITSRLKKKKSISSTKSKSFAKDKVFSATSLESEAKKIEQEPALIRIGKNGISETIISELKKLIPLKKAVKVKILQNSPIEDSKEFFNDLELKIGYKLWRKKGNTAIFIFKPIRTKENKFSQSS